MKGYDLRLFITELAGNGSSDLVARIKCDYNEVIGQMLLNNFTKPWVDWAHQNGAKAKNQAHGSPETFWIYMPLQIFLNARRISESLNF